MQPFPLPRGTGGSSNHKVLKQKEGLDSDGTVVLDVSSSWRRFAETATGKTLSFGSATGGVCLEVYNPAPASRLRVDITHFVAHPSHDAYDAPGDKAKQALLFGGWNSAMVDLMTEALLTLCSADYRLSPAELETHLGRYASFSAMGTCVGTHV